MHLSHLTIFLFFQSFFMCNDISEKSDILIGSAVLNPLAISGRQAEKTVAKAANIVFQSTDDGKSWQDVSAGLPLDYKAGEVVAARGELYLIGSKGMYRSNIVTPAPEWEKEILLDKSKNMVSPGKTSWYAYNSSGHFLQKQSNLGMWLPLFSNFKRSSVNSVMETSDGVIFIGCGNGLFKSIDQGNTWKHVYETGWVIQIVESDGVLLCTNSQGILRSADRGESWSVVISEGGVGIAVEPIDGGFAAISYNTESKTRRVRTSADGGKSWQPIDAGLPADATISSIKQAGSYLYCGHPDGVFRSSDKGKTWELVLPPVDKKVYNLSVNGKIVYAVTTDGGC